MDKKLILVLLVSILEIFSGKEIRKAPELPLELRNISDQHFRFKDSKLIRRQFGVRNKDMRDAEFEEEDIVPPKQALFAYNAQHFTAPKRH